MMAKLHTMYFNVKLFKTSLLWTDLASREVKLLPCTVYNESPEAGYNTHLSDYELASQPVGLGVRGHYRIHGT